MTPRDLNAVLKELQPLYYTEENIVELIYLINRAIEIERERNTENSRGTCLFFLLRTREKELRQLLEAQTPIEKDYLFRQVKTHFRNDLVNFCDCQLPEKGNEYRVLNY